MHNENDPASRGKPVWQLDPQAQGGQGVILRGPWTLLAIGAEFNHLRATLRGLGQSSHWDLREADAMDSAGALLLWHVWGGRLPSALALTDEQRILFERLESQPKTSPFPVQRTGWRTPLEQLGTIGIRIGRHLLEAVTFLGEVLLTLLDILRHPSRIPWRESSATLYKSGPQALGIIALVGLSIGVVISYQSALTLAAYGANIFIVNLLGLSVLRELGPMMAAVIIAGRSGSAFTAQLGVMRVTQEIDALQTFGVPPLRRLVIPKVLALAIALPLLVLWADAIALMGGMVVSKNQLGISYNAFLSLFPNAVPAINLWIGVGKGMIFGIIIALVASFYGLRVKPNTESLSRETTNAVVTAITLVILIDAVLAYLLADVGLS